MLAKDAKSLFLQPLRGISSVGRALAWHARGHRFESVILHNQYSLFVERPEASGRPSVRIRHPPQSI